MVPVALASVAQAQDIQLVANATLPGTLSDGLQLEPPLLEDGVTPHDQVGGWGSAIAYTGVGNLFIAAPDRGPADGTTSYLDRYYLLDIQLHPGVGAGLTIALRQSTLLTNDQGQLLTGSAAAFDATNSPASRRFDPEGIVLSGRGTFYISDEYGPFVYEFGAGGDRHKAKPLPPKFLIAAPSADPTVELGNLAGRQANRGMEGLAISPDGKKLYGLMQNALIQDGALDATKKRVGFNVRLLELDLETHATRELVYVLDHRGNGLNEILAINDHQFLVIERDGDAGLSASRKRIHKIDISGATDVSDLAALPREGLPPGVVPVAKSPFIDLLDPAFGLAGASFPEKIEGLAFGPRLPDGRLSLLVTSDNDFRADNPSRLFAFAIAPALLPGFSRQQLQVDTRVHGRRLDPGAPGLVPVTITGSQLLPAAALDPGSLRLAGAPVATVALPGGSETLCHRYDEDDDGNLDLICLFDQAQTSLPPRAREALLTGRTTSGTPVTGRATIRPPRR
jgi:hypothetical protein